MQASPLIAGTVQIAESLLFFPYFNSTQLNSQESCFSNGHDGILSSVALVINLMAMRILSP
jgi:hypothetical protein